MYKRLFALFLVLLPLSFAQVELDFTTIDNGDLSNHIVQIDFGKQKHVSILDSNVLHLNMPDGKYAAKIIIDDTKTSAPDYYALIEGTAPEIKKISILPIGYVQGKVIDMKNNLVPHANLKFSCYSTTILPTQADKTGFFSVPNFPVGDCTIIASSADIVGSAQIKVQKGIPTVVEIKLDQIAKNEVGIYSLIGGVLGTLLVVLFLFFVFKKTRVKPHKAKSGKSISNSSEAIIKTLSASEKLIVEYLITHNNQANQSTLRHEFKIARTTLSRIVKKLEQKKIIETQKHGKMVKITLTDFFLGK